MCPFRLQNRNPCFRQRPGGPVKFHSGCRMPDGAASFFLKAFPYRPPLQRMPAVRLTPAEDAAGERKQRLSPSMMKQIFLTAEGMLPGAGTTPPVGR